MDLITLTAVTSAYAQGLEYLRYEGYDTLLPPDKVDKRVKNKAVIPMDKVLRTPSRNESCPCDSRKKFKKCCGK